MPKVMILMFTSPTCQACPGMKPIAAELPNIRFIDVTVDYSTAAKYGIRSDLPAFVKLFDGEFESRINGSMSRSTLHKWAAL